MTGTIKKVTAKGFGFIQPNGPHAEVFFHTSQCATPFDEMREGDKVTFEVAQSPKGPRAVDVARGRG